MIGTPTKPCEPCKDVVKVEKSKLSYFFEGLFSMMYSVVFKTQNEIDCSGENYEDKKLIKSLNLWFRIGEYLFLFGGIVFAAIFDIAFFVVLIVVLSFINVGSGVHHKVIAEKDESGKAG